MTGKRKPGLSIEQHQELGRELASIRERLMTLSVMISNAYPRNSRIGRMVGGPSGAWRLDALRWELENRMFAEHGDDPRVTLRVYAGRRSTAIPTTTETR